LNTASRENGLSIIRATALSGVPHAFSTRTGGVSSGIFASLNFGNPGDLDAASPDPAANIARNFDLIARGIGTPGRRIVQVHQVHGNAVRVIRRGDAPEVPDPRADAIVTDDPEGLACVRVADCAPVLIASMDGQTVGSVHAGWRGVVSGVAERAVVAIRELMRRQGSDQRLAAAIGPCIGPEAFEVGPEVVTEFEKVFGSATTEFVRPCRDSTLGKATIDLKRALRIQLGRVGVETIEVIDRCTATEPECFFSHRRDHGRTGRMIGVIGCASRP